MKIAVTYKWAADPQEAAVDAQGNIDFSRAKPQISEYDAVAIAMGRRLADQAGAELVGISAGGPAAAAPLAAKAALSRGLDSAVVVAAPELEGAAVMASAQALAAAIGSLGDVALVLAGDSSIDQGARMVPAVLAGLLGWPALTDVAGLGLDGQILTARRGIGEGVQTLAAPLPAVVAVAAGAVPAPAPGMKDILAAAKKPVTALAPGELGLAPARAGTLLGRAKAGGPARACVAIDTADPAAAAAELVDRLAGAGVQIGGGR